MRLLLLTLTVLIACAAARAGNRAKGSRAPDPGVSRELARWRAEHYRDVRYSLTIELSPGAEMLKGVNIISVTLDNPAEDLVLDWRVVSRDVEPSERVSQIVVNGRAITDAQFVNDHIVIPARRLRAGENVLKLSFASPISASGSAVTRYRDREDNSVYIYTLFVPSDASTAFPCFDQPDLKARFKLSVASTERTWNTEWKVISNTSIDPTAQNGCDTGSPCPMEYHFLETAPLSTYQFAFAAGPFVEFKDESSPYGTRLYVRKSKAERAKKELAEIFRVNRDGLKFFEQYFAHKFPFTKYDLIVIPEFPYGGMEHAGATFLREEAVFFPSDPTAADVAARAELMLHEAAHQWFGDLVTMRWFDDLWLKEGFATFMAYKALETLDPQQNAWQTFHLRTKPLAYQTDATRGTTPIFQEIPNLSAAKSAYGNIVYRKAPSVLRQAEFYLGPDKFQRAVRSFVRKHAYSNAEWADLVRAFERASRRRLGAWADAWVRRRGMPEVKVFWEADGRGRIKRFTVEQSDVLNEGGAWPMRLKILLGRRARAGRQSSEVIEVELKARGGPQHVPEAIGRARPVYVFANYEDYGYGRFLLDEESRRALLSDWKLAPDAFTRALLWGSLWEAVREAELAPTSYVELALKEARGEHDNVVLQSILARVQTAYTRYMSDAQQQRLARPLEDVLLHQSLYAPTSGERITYFRAFREVASTTDAFNNLRQILEGSLKVPGMNVRARDRFDIARALVAAGAPHSLALLRKLSDEDKTDDGRRYAYAAFAAAPDPELKRQYFDDFTRNPSIPESWIEAAFVTFNAPRQSALTLPYLEPALRELPTLKRTRKIFFVNGWLASFIGGQCSPSALDTVNDFLRRESQLDPDLRLKVLEAVDGLERCVRIRAKFAGAEGGRNHAVP